MWDMNILFSSGQTPRNIFSLYLEAGHQKGSKLIFGGVDSQYYVGNITYTPIISFTSYMIHHGGLKIGDYEMPKLYEAALVDSGNSCFTIPRPLIEKIRELLNEKYNIRCEFFIESYAPDFSMMDCFLTEESKPFPPLTLYINNRNFTLNPDDYIYECRRNKHNGTSRCFTKLELSESMEFLLLGMAFHHSFYVIFDLEKRRIGFGKSIAENTIKYVGYTFDQLPGNSRSFLEREEVHSSSELALILGCCLVLPLLVLFGCLIRKKFLITHAIDTLPLNRSSPSSDC
jgi:hypothetical protein